MLSDGARRNSSHGLSVRSLSASWPDKSNVGMRYPFSASRHFAFQRTGLLVDLVEPASLPDDSPTTLRKRPAG